MKTEKKNGGTAEGVPAKKAGKAAAPRKKAERKRSTSVVGGPSPREKLVSKAKTAQEFHIECLGAFVDASRKFGLCEQGPVHIPALDARCEESVVALMKHPGLISVFGKEPMIYYYHVLGYSFAMGVVLSMLWHNARKKFRDEDLVTMIVSDQETSPHELSITVLGQFGVTLDLYNLLVKDVYEAFVDLHETHWSATEDQDPRDYTIAAFYAAFNLGSAIVLGKCGYQASNG